MAGSGEKSGSASTAGLAVAAVLGAVVVALALGAAVPWAPLGAALAALGVVCVARFGLTTVLLHVLVLSMFFEGVSVGGVRVGRVLAAVVPVILFLRYTTTGWRPGRIPPLAWVPALLFAAWSWTSGFWADDSDAWVATMGALALAAAYFLAFALLVDSPAQVRQLLRTFVLGAGVLAIVALGQAGVDVRSVGLQGDPNIFALYQVAAIPAAGMLARTARSAWVRVGWLLVIVPVVASVFAAQSRGGLLTLAVLLPVALIRGDLGRAGRFHTWLSAVFTVVVIGGLVSLAARVDERLSLERVLEDRGTGRLDIWRAAWAAYVREPLLGMGAGGFKPQSSHLLETTPGVGIDPYSILLRTGIRVHNTYLECLTELGPVGLALWLSVLVGTFVVLRRIGATRLSKAATSPLVLMLFTFAVATLFLSVTNSKLLWMVAGLAAAAASARYGARRGARPSRSPSVRTSVPGVPARAAVTVAGEPGPSTSPITYSAPTGPGWRSPSGPLADDHRSPGPVGD